MFQLVDGLDETTGWQKCRHIMNGDLVFQSSADYNASNSSPDGWPHFRRSQNQEGVHLVVPPEFANFLISSAGAGAALVGLLFVAVSLAPERIVTRGAPVERQAVAGSAFTALVNTFFISLVALIPHFNVGSIIVPFSFLCLLTSLIQAWQLLRLRKGWLSLLRGEFLVLLSFALYGFELVNAFQLINDPTQVGFVYGLLLTLLGVFILGLTRAWELLGVQWGLFGWLNPLRDMQDTESFRVQGMLTQQLSSPQPAMPHSIHYLRRVSHSGTESGTPFFQPHEKENI
jgi:hypothetical protein